MFASYRYNAGAIQSQILADIVAILTGTTDKNTLSASCDKANTSIFSAYYAAGWTMHDNAAAANRVVIKALCADGVHTKYVGIDMNTANTLRIGGAETWNAITHTGTNMATVPGTTDCAAVIAVQSSHISTALGGYLYIFSDQTSIAISGKTTGNNSTPVGVMEWSRAGVNMALAGGYPCWGVSGGSNFSAMARVRAKNPTAAGDVVGNNGNTGACVTSFVAGSTNGITTSSYRRYTDDVTIRDAVSIKDSLVCGHNSFFNNMGVIYDYLGKPLTDMYLCATGADLDEMVLGGITYIRMAHNSGIFGALYNNAIPLWVPKG